MENTLKMFGKDANERVENALKELKSGKGVILLDDEDREN